MPYEDIEYMREQVVSGFDSNKRYVLKLIDEGQFERLQDEMDDIRNSTSSIFDEVEGILEDLVEADEDDEWDDDEDEDDEEDTEEDE